MIIVQWLAFHLDHTGIESSRGVRALATTFAVAARHCPVCPGVWILQVIMTHHELNADLCISAIIGNKEVSQSQQLHFITDYFLKEYNCYFLKSKDIHMCTFLTCLWCDFILQQSFSMFKQPRKLRLVRPKSSSQVPTNPIEWRQKLRLPSHMSHKNFPSTSHGIGDEFWSVIGRRAFAFWHSL